MSLQFNYFAKGSDCLLIAHALIEVFGEDFYWIPPRGLPEEMRFHRVTTVDELLASTPGEMRFIVGNEWRSAVTVLSLETGSKCVRIGENPVVEYSPSSADSDGTVHIGRLFYAYEAAPELRRRVQRLFRVLRKGADLYMGKKGLWIFPQARQEAPFLQQWVGKPWENAMRE